MDSKTIEEMFDFWNELLYKDTITEELINNATIYYETWDCDEEDCFYDAFSEEIGAVSWDNGVSKLCVRLPEYPDYIFKIPFRGEYIFKEDEGVPSTNEIYNKRYVPQVTFRYASKVNPYASCDWDYAEAEEHVFFIMEQEFPELRPMFAETAYVGTFYDMNVYVSEYVAIKANDATIDDIIERNFDDSTKESSRSIHSSGLAFDMSDYNTCRFIEAYGADLVSRLAYFADNLGIEDFHSGNFRYDDKTGRPILIDYSSFDSRELKDI